MASNNSSSTAKTHVSLRLPTYLLEAIDAHAEKENISRTEAFVHYLQTGLDIADAKAEEPSKSELLLQNIQDDITVIKALLSTQPVVLTEVDDDMFDDSDAVEEVFEATPSVGDTEGVASEFATSDEVEAVDEVVEDIEDEPSAYSTEERAASEEAAEDYTGSDAVFAETYETVTDESDVIETSHEVVEDNNEYSTSDAVFDNMYASGSANEEERDDEDLRESLFDDSDEVEEGSTDVTFYAEESEEAYVEEVENDTAKDEAETSYYESVEETLDEQTSENALSFKKLEKAVTKAAKQVSSIEKVWVYGAAAEEKEVTTPIIDLCVKASDDKIKSKHLEAFVTAVEERTHKTVSVMLKHDVTDDDKLAMKNKVEVYKN